VNDVVLALELRRLADEVQSLRRAVEALQRERHMLTPAQRAVAEVTARLYAAGEKFTAGELLSATRFDPDSREVLRQACGLDAQKLGIVLSQIAMSGAAVSGHRLVKLPREGGVRRLVLEVAESP
jgi:hypothetical protein